MKNIEILNEKYAEHLNFKYIKDENIIKVEEKKPYLLNSKPELKNQLKKELNMVFNNRNHWHLPKYQVNILSQGVFKSFSNEEIKEMENKIFEYIDSINDESLKNSIINIFKQYPSFFEKPAAVKHHHNYKGGLVEHTIEVYDLAFSMAAVLNKSQQISINMDLLKAGALLHDIGKVDCYEFDSNGGIKVTPTYILQNHIVHGIQIISKNIVHNLVGDLIHIIASHHQLQEWGSPIPPETNEAWIIHFSDNLSSKVLGKKIIS